MALGIALWKLTRRLLGLTSLQSRLLATYLLLIVVGLGVVIGWAGTRLATSTLDQAKRDLELQAVLIGDTLAGRLSTAPEDFLYTKGLLHSFGRSLDARVSIVDRDLRLLAASQGTDESGAGGGASQEALKDVQRDIQSARDHSLSSGFTITSWRDSGRLIGTAPVVGELSRPIARVLLSVSDGPTAARISKHWFVLFSTGGVVLVATIAVSVLVARQVTRPVRKVTRVSEAMAAGDLSQRVQAGGPQEVKRLARSFNTMADRVEEMLARQRAFVGDAAHELRSPLTALRLRVDLMREHGRQDPAVVERFLPELARQVEQLQRLAEHLLALSRADAGQQLKREPVDLAPLLYDLADEMGPLFQAANLEFHVDSPPHLPAVIGDQDALRIAVRNLLDNAIQYTPASGRVGLAGVANTGSVLVTVSDTGEGIPPSAIPRIFDRFFRVDRARSRRKGGAGLGLTLVRSIVEAHGGGVTVESAVGQGSTFTLRLPASNWTG